MSYQVETKIGHDWENVWTEDDKPLTFASSTAARAAISAHLRDCKAAGIEANAKDFRVAPVAA